MRLLAVILIVVLLGSGLVLATQGKEWIFAPDVKVLTAPQPNSKHIQRQFVWPGQVVSISAPYVRSEGRIWARVVENNWYVMIGSASCPIRLYGSFTRHVGQRPLPANAVLAALRPMLNRC